MLSDVGIEPLDASPENVRVSSDVGGYSNPDMVRAGARRKRNTPWETPSRPRIAPWPRTEADRS